MLPNSHLADTDDDTRHLQSQSAAAGGLSWKDLQVAEERPTEDPQDPPTDPTPDPEDETPDPPVEPETPEDPEPEVPEEPAGADSAPAITPVALAQTTTVDGGRVTTFTVGNGQDIASIRITDDPAHGMVSVNPDNTLALVLSGSDHSGALSFEFDITYANGATETRSATLNVTAPKQEAGWGEGKHYMLETDAQGDLVIETGDNHRKVYVSESNSALTRADIAVREGVSESTVTGKWLLDHPEYGGSEGKALATDIGMDLWYAMTFPQGTEVVVASHWLLFEKGHTYEDTRGLFYPGVSGESPLQPIYISSWGEGSRPVLEDQITLGQFGNSNIVIDDVAPKGGIRHLDGENFLVNDSEFTGSGINIQNVDGFALRDSDLSHIVSKTAVDGKWAGGGVGLFSKLTDGILLEDNIFHHIGWEDGYSPDASTSGGMPPSMFAHNIYLQNNTTDVTFRDNIVSQGASYGAQIRGGGFVEDNVFVDNNAAVNVLGGIYESDGPIGNYTFFADNLITSGGHKTWTHGGQGGLTLGLTDQGYDTTFLDNIIAHLADPNDPADLAAKYQTHSPFTTNNGIAYDDTIIYNWRGNDPSVATYAVDNNTPGLNEARADQTTIQNFAASLLGQNKATIAEMMDAVLAGQAEVTADDIIAYFQAGFGVTPNGSGSAHEHRFIPDALAGGIRWDNRINWDSEELPTNGDSVHLGGNHVQYGGTTRIDDLDLGGGALYVNHGKLAVDGALDSSGGRGLIQTANAGQFWVDGFQDNRWLKIEVEGGRFANTGEIAAHFNVIASAGQTLLATSGGSYTISDNARLRVEGSEARVGFDGADSRQATLKIEDGGRLVFKSDTGGFSTIEEFRSGHWDQAGTPVNSSVELGGTLRINFKDYAAGPDSHVLIAVDEITGAFDDFEFRNLDPSLKAKVVVDYKTDTLRLDVSKSGQPFPGNSADTLPGEDGAGQQTGGTDAPEDWLLV